MSRLLLNVFNNGDINFLRATCCIAQSPWQDLQVSLEYEPTFLGHSFLHSIMPWDFPKQILKEAKDLASGLWTLRMWACFLLYSFSESQTPTSHGRCSQGCLQHLQFQWALVSEHKIQQNISAHLLLYHLGHEAVVASLQKHPWLCMPCCVVPSAHTKVAEVAHEVSSLGHLFFLISWL